MTDYSTTGTTTPGELNRTDKHRDDPDTQSANDGQITNSARSRYRATQRVGLGP